MMKTVFAWIGVIAVASAVVRFAVKNAVREALIEIVAADNVRDPEL